MNLGLLLRRVFVPVLVTGLVWGLGCSQVIGADDYKVVSDTTTSSATGTAATSATTGGTGTGATLGCNAWHAALCGWGEKCKGLDVVQCLDQVGAVACVSEQKARDCAVMLGTASCTDTFTGCDVFDLADRGPAMVACNHLIDQVCVTAQRCDPTETSDVCHQSAMTGLDCSKAIGVKPSFDQCMAEIKVEACPAATLPASCQGAIVISSD